jgi:hypothetical protein
MQVQDITTAPWRNLFRWIRPIENFHPEYSKRSASPSFSTTSKFLIPTQENNPLYYTDPDGKFVQIAPAAAAAVAGGVVGGLVATISGGGFSEMAAGMAGGAVAGATFVALAPATALEMVAAGGVSTAAGNAMTRELSGQENTSQTLGGDFLAGSASAGIAAGVSSGANKIFGSYLGILEQRVDGVVAVNSSATFGRAGNFIPQVSKENLAANVGNSLFEYEQNGWQKIQGLKVKTYSNYEGYLPAGQTYTEFDVNPKLGPTRDAQRFFLGSKEGVYFTDTHMDPTSGNIVKKIVE